MISIYKLTDHVLDAEHDFNGDLIAFNAGMFAALDAAIDYIKQNQGVDEDASQVR